MKGKPTPRSYSISAEDIAAESERVGGDLDKFDVSRVIRLDELELREMGPADVHMRILAASAGHNVDHAALADTTNIAEAPGRSSPRRSTAVSPLGDRDPAAASPHGLSPKHLEGLGIQTIDQQELNRFASGDDVEAF
jgi:hypothetical protein